MKKQEPNTDQAVTRGISLRPVQDLAVMTIAIEDGHLNRSRVFQELIDDEMVRRHGPDWIRRFGEKSGAV